MVNTSNTMNRNLPLSLKSDVYSQSIMPVLSYIRFEENEAYKKEWQEKCQL